MSDPKVEIGPGWSFIQALDADLLPTGIISNLLFNQELVSRFKVKEYLIPADNSATEVASVKLGLEECVISQNLVSISTDILAAMLAISRTAAATPFTEDAVLDITGYGKSPLFRALAIYPNLLENDNVFSVIESGGNLVCTVIEIRVGSMGGDAVEYSGKPDKERLLPLTIKGQSKPGITAIPAKMQRTKTVTLTAGAFNSATVAAWPITSLY